MKNKRSLLIIAAVAAVLTIVYFMSFNGLVKKDEKVKLQWNEVQNAYQRRMDLIPNLVNTVKGNAAFEQNTLVRITEARAKAQQVTASSDSLSADNFNKQANAQNELAGAANALIITIEKYPELQGAKAFAALQTQLERTELRIKIARKDFNEAVQAYNSSVRTFPASLVAAVSGFKAKEGFQSDAGAEKATEINFK